jgi:poly(A) polymerase
MIRALRFASTLDLNVEENTYQAILRQREHMSHASNARMYEEILKFFYSGAMEKAFTAWQETGLLEIMFPGMGEWVLHHATEEDRSWQTMALQQLDKWKAHNIKASPELAYTLFLAPWILAIRDRRQEDPDVSPRQALLDAVQEVQQMLHPRILIPKRTAFRIFDLLQAQSRFKDRRSEQRVTRFLHRPYFRDALVLFKFNALACGKPQSELIEAWTQDLQKAPPPQERKERAHPQRRRRRRRRTHH